MKIMSFAQVRLFFVAALLSTFPLQSFAWNSFQFLAIPHHLNCKDGETLATHTGDHLHIIYDVDHNMNCLFSDYLFSGRDGVTPITFQIEGNEVFIRDGNELVRVGHMSPDPNFRCPVQGAYETDLFSDFELQDGVQYESQMGKNICERDSKNDLWFRRTQICLKITNKPSGLVREYCSLPGSSKERFLSHGDCQETLKLATRVSDIQK